MTRVEPAPNLFADPTGGPFGHAHLVRGLWRSAADGRLPHALLLQGPEGVGKFAAARWLAQGLLCESGPGQPCLTCGPCKRARSGNHPDLLELDPRAVGQDTLTIHFVAPRERKSGDDYDGPTIDGFLGLRAMEGGWRIVLVREVERANEAAQNALLKPLEEPGSDALLVLETSRPAALLETVRSRLVPVAFRPLGRGDTAAVLVAHGLPPERAATLARWSGGAPGRALALEARAVGAMRELLLDVVSGRERAARAAALLWELEGDFPGKTAAASRRLRARTLLDLGLELWLDAERAAAGVERGELAHGDALGDLPATPAASRERRLDAWLSARQDVALNLSPEALVDRALVAAAPEEYAGGERASEAESGP